MKTWLTYLRTVELGGVEALDGGCGYRLKAGVPWSTLLRRHETLFMWCVPLPVPLPDPCSSMPDDVAAAEEDYDEPEEVRAKAWGGQGAAPTRLG